MFKLANITLEMLTLIIIESISHKFNGFNFLIEGNIILIEFMFIFRMEFLYASIEINQKTFCTQIYLNYFWHEQQQQQNIVIIQKFLTIYYI